jgi:hypothetical protein
MLDGTYYLTGHLGYSGPGEGTTPPGIDERGVLVLSGGTLKVLIVQTGAQTGTTRQSGTFTTTGSTLNFFWSCGASGSEVDAFTASATELHVYIPPATPQNIPAELVFTRQG